MQTRQSTRSYIETMYRSGGDFKYDFTPPPPPPPPPPPGGIESRSNDIKAEMSVHKNNLLAMKIQSENMKKEFNEDYQHLRRDVTEEIDNFQMKLSMEMNRQKKKNIEINQEMNDLKNEIVKSKNLLFELQERVKALQLRVNGQ